MNRDTLEAINELEDGRGATYTLEEFIKLCKDMAEDCDREREAIEWCEGLMRDVDIKE